MHLVGSYFKNINLEVCRPRCVCENWKGHVVKQHTTAFQYISYILRNKVCM